MQSVSNKCACTKPFITYCGNSEVSFLAVISWPLRASSDLMSAGGCYQSVIPFECLLQLTYLHSVRLLKDCHRVSGVDRQEKCQRTNQRAPVEPWLQLILPSRQFPVSPQGHSPTVAAKLHNHRQDSWGIWNELSIEYGIEFFIWSNFVCP